jgi:gamma-tubulin complex component 2
MPSVVAHRSRARPRAPPPVWDTERSYLTRAALWVPSVSSSSPSTSLAPPHAVCSLDSYPAAAQDAVAADDVLSALLGVPGSFSRVTSVGHFSFCSADSPGASDAAVPALAQRVLALADDHLAVCAFVERTRIAVDAPGHVLQALGVALGELLGDYRAFVLRLEGELRAGRLGLQRLLFYVQPSMRSMALLRRVVKCVDGKTGGAALDAVYMLAAAHVGSADARAVLAFVVGRTAAPVLDAMQMWMCDGVVDDTFAEFFVEEAPRVSSTAESWDRKYSVNHDNLPGFLAQFVANILSAGKYLNVMRDNTSTASSDLTDGPSGAAAAASADTSGDDAQAVAASRRRIDLDGDVLLGPDASRRLAAFVDRAYLLSSSRLLAHLRDGVKVLSRLRSIKRYFMMEHGDFVVHFFDAAHDELSKPAHLVSLNKLSSLLELSVRTSVSACDPFHEDLSCTLFDVDFTSQIVGSAGSPAAHPSATNAAPPAPPSLTPPLTGYDTFSLTYAVASPMNLIVSDMAVLKYQLLFRYLFHCKHVERELEGCWRNLAQVKGANRGLRGMFARTFDLRHRMLQFLRNILYYVVADVLEPNWQRFEAAYGSAETIDEIMAHHASFLDACMSQCLLSNERHLRVLHSVTHVCLLFASYTEQFTRDLSNGTPATDIARGMASRGYQATIAKFEKTFDTNLRLVLDGLSTMSKRRASTHLANLCDRLDFGGFYERAAVHASAALTN